MTIRPTTIITTARTVDPEADTLIWYGTPAQRAAWAAAAERQVARQRATERERTRAAAGCTPGHRPPVVVVEGDAPPTLRRRHPLLGWWRSDPHYTVTVGRRWLDDRYGYGA
jgi:hypothetical protein